ncbi:flagellar hook-length control protein FliK [Aeromonas veronii]|uniref:flagellar hook-length control protein FliK n=1 Tax=Aeromonas veronii TaxID=654 RepID=UPI00187F7276|nr:flagellar hook-length control protein FliK [Aeromonas veronii]MBE8734631.1 flagellar hook-length control protein FliK [Aeromonas veronii]MBE8740182.1 flagellar hook-length control protein FliK [Aeromonas veronii]MBE8743231.1 flagellar hook-length control protein FliK [Aeromonas veronii]MBE8762535.1 flagellar hook-length control protein FliK [Aeromonas veronii]MBE8838777.1 flagellar hook-length control protein FliK [Aeromonas veronii]
MMQTLLTQTPSAPANGLDKAPLSGSVESKSIDGGTGSDSKGDFATLIAKARNSEQGAAEATQGGNHVRSAKSLATESAFPKEEIGKEQDPDADNKVEEVPATDFLLRLQDSLKLDTSLVTPQLAVAAQQSATVVDGNPLPQEGELEGIALDESEQTPAAARIAQQLAGQTGAQSPLATTANSTPETTVSSSAARVVAQGDASAAVLSSEGEDTATTADEQTGEKASAKGETLGADGKHTKPLTGAERMAQLAKVLPVDESASTAKSVESLATKETGDSKSDLVASNALTNKGQTTQATTQGAALKAFSEGLKQTEAGAATTSATADGSGVAGKGAEKGVAEGSQQPATAVNQGSAPVTTAQSAAESAAAQGSVTANATAQSDSAAAPVMVAPQQVLAQAESQGPQAPLSTISAGIKQMGVTGTDEVRKAVSLEVKPKAGEAEKSLVATTSSGESTPSQTVQHGQNSQTQPQVADSRAPAAETTLRRESQNLPHLKLASQEAPAELHQKVNVMLAEKLQQAEIQLDPLGLGKMKIQIQMGADSQANVHFVVQHGQTREMLEQAMPRLRDMLAGQGIQLGQTQVQQQSQQQQQQGQPTFNGQGQQGQSSGQPRSGNGLVEGELTTSNPSLLVESTNGSGIDFYA